MDRHGYIGGPVAVSSTSQPDDTILVFTLTEEVISVAPSTSTGVLEGHVEHADQVLMQAMSYLEWASNFTD